jgi:4-diphosphocytidyl-2-C-methyl-D-erythritol kinase
MLSLDAPAKINLGLHVLRKRQDGFHDIETVMIRIGWSDALMVEPAEKLVLSCDDPSLSSGDDNLCLKAAKLLQKEMSAPEGAHLHLRKRLPYGAGLGGGSSDAAATLRLLCRLWDVRITRQRLAEIAAEIGSDVPFFLHAPAAFAFGRGEKLHPLKDEYGRPLSLPFNLVVIVPDMAVSTAEAYRLVSADDRSRPDLIDIVQTADLATYREHLVNDFEKPIVARHPEIGAALDLLRESGAGYAALSGSGSAVFGLFEEEETARAAADAARSAAWRVWHGGLNAGEDLADAKVRRD